LACNFAHVSSATRQVLHKVTLIFQFQQLASNN
jgi:hypothetical protein